MAGADTSADLPENRDASGRLEGIEGGLRDQRRQALRYLDGIRILESLVQLFQQGRLTSEDLSKLSALIKARVNRLMVLQPKYPIPRFYP